MIKTQQSQKNRKAWDNNKNWKMQKREHAELTLKNEHALKEGDQMSHFSYAARTP